MERCASATGRKRTEDRSRRESQGHRFGPPSGLTCPDCGGASWDIEDGKLIRYRCHVGHQYTAHSMDAEQRRAVETALWTAVRVLEERAELRTRMAQRATDSGMESVAKGFADTAREAQQQAATIRQLLFARPEPAPATPKKRPRATRRINQAQRRR